VDDGPEVRTLLEFGPLDCFRIDPFEFGHQSFICQWLSEQVVGDNRQNGLSKLMSTAVAYKIKSNYLPQ
jgi:hypothetical protein